MININDLKKDLYKTKNVANFMYYCKGNLYYMIEVANERYPFPISTIETDDKDNLILSNDLGTTPFNSEIKGSELIRWMTKAIENDEFIKIY